MTTFCSPRGVEGWVGLRSSDLWVFWYWQVSAFLDRSLPAVWFTAVVS